GEAWGRPAPRDGDRAPSLAAAGSRDGDRDVDGHHGRAAGVDPSDVETAVGRERQIQTRAPAVGHLSGVIERTVLERRIGPTAVGRGTRVRVLDADGPD